MRVIFLDGESKSGKTAVGRAISDKLTGAGYTTSKIVVGDFFRRLTLLALRNNAAGGLEAAVKKALAASELYNLEYDASELASDEIDALVSSVGQLEIAQKAVAPWREKAADAANASGVDILIMDGRNLRARMSDWLATASVPVALELVIACRASVAASRYLADNGNTNPASEQLAAASAMIKKRRVQDRTRNEAPYVDPANPVVLVAGRDNASRALALAFDASASNPPLAIRFDNSEVPREIGLATVSELALLAAR